MDTRNRDNNMPIDNNSDQLLKRVSIEPEEEMQKLFKDIKGLLKEKIVPKRFINGFSNNPN